MVKASFPLRLNSLNAHDLKAESDSVLDSGLVDPNVGSAVRVQSHCLGHWLYLEMHLNQNFDRGQQDLKKVQRR